MLDPDISTTEALALLARRASAIGSPLDRRRFLQLVGMGVGAGLVAGAASVAARPTRCSATTRRPGPPDRSGRTDGVLVVIGMFGGNDGLNTVVPFNDRSTTSSTARWRSRATRRCRSAGGLGLNPALTELKRFWDAGQLAIVAGRRLSERRPLALQLDGVLDGRPGRAGSRRPVGSAAGSTATSGGGQRPVRGCRGRRRRPAPPRRRQPARHGRARPARPDFGAGTESRDAADVPGDACDAAPPSTGRGTLPSAQAFVDQLDLARRSPGHYPRRRGRRQRDRRQARGRRPPDQRQPRVPRADGRLGRLRQSCQPARRCTPPGWRS